jgi:hypothetical protein
MMLLSTVIRAVRSASLAAMPGLADPHAAGAEIVQVRVLERAVETAFAEPDHVGSHMADLAAAERYVPRAVGHDDRFDRRGGLSRLEAAGRRQPLSVLERQPFDLDVLDKVPRRRVALKHQEPVDDRRDHAGRGHVLTGQRLVVQRAVAGQEKFARRVQRGEEVLQVVMRVAAPRVPGLHPFAAGDDRLLLGVQRSGKRRVLSQL